MSIKGERYKSQKGMRMHELSEGAKEREMEYGTPRKRRRVRKPGLSTLAKPVPPSGKVPMMRQKKGY